VVCLHDQALGIEADHVAVTYSMIAELRRWRVSRMREICTYGSMRGVEVQRGPTPTLRIDIFSF
jgi:hypothetical protein